MSKPNYKLGKYNLYRDEFGWVLSKLHRISPSGVKMYREVKRFTGRQAYASDYGRNLAAFKTYMNKREK